MASVSEKWAEAIRDCGTRPVQIRTLTWVTASSISLLTTKYLLSDGYNYPLHLLSAHLVAAIVLESLCSLAAALSKESRPTLSTAEPLSNRPHHVYATVGLAAYFVTGGAATMLGYQALEHFDTFPALVTTLICVAQPWDIHQSGRTLDGRSILCLILFVASVSSVYLLDAKLEFKGVGSALLAVIFVTMAKAEYRWFVLPWKTEDSMVMRKGATSILAFIAALAVVAISCWKWETPIYSPLSAYGVRWILLSNMASSALAFKLAWSPFWQLSTVHDLGGNAELPMSVLPSILPPWIAMATTSAASVISHLGFPMNHGQYASCFVMMESLSAMSAQARDVSQDLSAREEHEVSRTPLLSLDEPSMEASGQQPFVNDVEANLMSKLALLSPAPARPRRPTTISAFLVLRGLIMAALCLGLTYVDMYTPFENTQKRPSRLQSPAGPVSQTLDLVVSYYDEPVTEVAAQLKDLINLPALRNVDKRVILYNKGNMTESERLPQDIAEVIGIVPEMITLPNIGKEAVTFLHHMNTRWDALATHTLFMQAHMHNFQTSKQRINQYFVPQTAFLPLSPLEFCRSFEDCTDHSTWSEEPEILERIYREANEDQKLETLLLTYRGQFIASASQIRSGGQQHLLNLLAELRDEHSYTHSSGYADHPWMSGKEDSMVAPRFGYTIERMWPAILRCSEQRVLRNCPSPLSGYLRSLLPMYSPRVEDCQCLDEF